MKKTENRSIQANWFARIAAIMLAAVLAISYLPTTRAYAASDKTDKSKTSVAKAALDSEPSIREVHKVKVGKKRYCFFVTHNVVMTPAEIAQFGDDDEKLTDEVLKRAGLYIKEENCKLATHKVISPEDWKKMGGTLSLSQVEIYEEEEDDPADTSDDNKDSETADDGNDGDSSDSGDGSGDNNDGDSSGNTSDTGNTGDNNNDSNDSNAGNTSDAGDSSDAGDTSDESGDSETNDSSKNYAAKASGWNVVKVEAVEALRKAAPTDGDPARFYMDLVITAETPKEGSSAEPKKYSTFKKSSPNSPKLIYIAVATEEDAKLGEEICEMKNGSSNNSGTKKQKMPSLKETGEDDDEMLPEFRSISMTDRSGGPLEPTLKDGDPVTLEWKEPGRQTDAEGGSGFFEQKWAIPALTGVAVLLAAALIFILRRRRNANEEEE